MNAQVKKEIRLLLPSCIAALLLAFAPVFLPEAHGLPLLLAWFGLVMMAVNSAGREFSLGTFSPLLVQPWPRTRSWWTKVSILALAQLIVFGIWCAVFSIRPTGHSETASGDFFLQHALLEGGLFVLAVYSGGLWTSLLFRQMAPAFLMTLLVPVALAVSLASLMDRYPQNAVDAVLSAVFGLYAIAGFWWARRLFLRAQDVAWTGGTVSLPRWPFSRAQSSSFVQTRRRRPIAALFSKELQLHYLTLACAGALLVLHFVIIFMRMAKPKSFTAIVALEGFWCLWLVMPVIIGCTAVAEERKLGVAEGQLCLPVSRRVQFTIKFLLVMVLGTLLGGVLPCAIECCGIALGAPNSMFPKYVYPFPFPLIFLWVIPCSLGLAMIAFFASTLARNFLQALAIALVAIVGCAALILYSSIPQTVFGITLWRFVLADVIGVPTMIVALLWLAYRNFKEFHESRRLWRLNLLGVAAALAFVVGVSAALYNRIWELFTPLEPPHGTARLTLSKPPHMRCDDQGNLTVFLMPDGRVWLDKVGYSWEGEWQDAFAGLLHPLPGSLGPHQFIGGSNWVDVTARSWAIIGIRSDGSLWIAEKTNRAAWLSPKLIRFGDETNWLAVAAQWLPSALLLKKDGTLWGWGTNHEEWTSNQRPRWPWLRACKPYRVGTNSDWAQVFSFYDVYARRNDGTVWTMESNNLVQATAFRQTKWRSLASGWNENLCGIRDDGTLWICPQVWTNSHWVASEMVQVGKGKDWEAVAASGHSLVALKSDGTLWKWDVYRMAPSEVSAWNWERESPSVIANATPTRLGIHKDWVAVAKDWHGVVSLAADGSLWFWPDKSAFEYSSLLKLSRKPELLANIFGPPD
jgi:ABC-type transport system involved in multi-copper enzyme maturation permease subunit